MIELKNKINSYFLRFKEFYASEKFQRSVYGFTFILFLIALYNYDFGDYKIFVVAITIILALQIIRNNIIFWLILLLTYTSLFIIFWYNALDYMLDPINDIKGPHWDSVATIWLLIMLLIIIFIYSLKPKRLL